MKEQIKQIIANAPNTFQARNWVREYCQARILQFLQERGVFTSWVFHGGTALRFLHLLPRYSEDLDFALLSPASPSDFGEVIAHVQRSFEAETYSVSLKIKELGSVRSAFIRLPGLLHELDLSPQRKEVLSIKIEVDFNPPPGGETETSIIRRYVVLHVLHYDKASMLSGKLHAILMRPYFKGRDLYDLFWYLSDSSWPDPNYRFLNEALRQTKWPGPEITASNWIEQVGGRLRNVDWRKALNDVRPFIERESELAQLTEENVLKTLETRRLRIL